MQLTPQELATLIRVAIANHEASFIPMNKRGNNPLKEAAYSLSIFDAVRLVCGKAYAGWVTPISNWLATDRNGAKAWAENMRDKQ